MTGLCPTHIHVAVQSIFESFFFGINKITLKSKLAGGLLVTHEWVCMNLILIHLPSKQTNNVQ